MILKQVSLLFLTTIILTVSSASGQTSEYKKRHPDICASFRGRSGPLKTTQPKFGAGVKGGINYASQQTNSSAGVVDFQNIIGINAGAYVNYYFMNFLAIQPELMISGKGSRWKNEFYDAKYNLTYVDLPILIKFQPVKQFNIHAGPQLSYLMFANQYDYTTGQRTNVMGNFYKLDIALAGGIELNLPLRLSLTVRYVYGLKPATNGATYTETWTNKYFQASLGYRILGR
jgi:hypothetical protein